MYLCIFWLCECGSCKKKRENSTTIINKCSKRRKKNKRRRRSKRSRSLRSPSRPGVVCIEGGEGALCSNLIRINRKDPETLQRIEVLCIYVKILNISNEMYLFYLTFIIVYRLRFIIDFKGKINSTCCIWIKYKII